MKFTGRAEIDRPAADVFERLADFSRMEEIGRKRHVAFRRLDSLDAPGPGMEWAVDFRYRGRMRRLDTRLERMIPPETLEYSGVSAGFEMQAAFVLTSLARTRTRLNVSLELKPRTLGARLLLQSARLGKSALERRFEERVEVLGEFLEGGAAKAG